ncbi:GlcG/HbpS family heme-binding protein [Marinobacter sp. CA1]|uniref:GlcG/HbpS family heme-binding protein n=1 Tax=Marinobacter sp. CA1 TaxID=2817656 RepID=UPI001D07DC56|nr:heme-binding protein [Marinobacter sp. CA1]UDL07025.1 heme-binding protein [Marinobacter sp. CA1]
MFDSITDTHVQAVINRACERAAEQGFAISVAVTDTSGLLKGFVRMENAVPGTIDVATKKARTAALFRADSNALGAEAHPGGSIYTIENTNGGLISFGGGLVLHEENEKIVGAVGVAGATVEDDQTIALYAAGRI